MTEDELAELLQDCSTLDHMAEAGSWAPIRRHGLLGISALLDLVGVEGAAREAAEGRAGGGARGTGGAPDLERQVARAARMRGDREVGVEWERGDP